MQHKTLRRLLSGFLAAAVAVNGLVISPLAENNTPVDFTKVSNKNVSAEFGRKPFEEKEKNPGYAANDVVRVSIFLKDKSTIEAGFEVKDIAENYAAINYREGLQRKQDAVVTEIERVTKKELDVVWNLTLAANLISANVEFGQIEKIEKLSDVKKVVVETQYQPDVVKKSLANDPNMATSSAQVGSSLAWAAGYTGAGSRVAIIDTGTDDDHQSFSEEGYLYSLSKQAEKAGKTLDAYMAGLNLLTAKEIADVADQLNVEIDPAQAYMSAKLPFAYNYVDGNYQTNHDRDTQGEHGSHVAGIATANSYIKTENGFEPALTAVKTQGVAPDAQLITMKVFGAGGGAYDSDYMVAIEDAIVLKADSINLSLGSGNPGMSKHDNADYQAIMDNLVECGVVVSISAGNSGAWADDSDLGDILNDYVNFQTDGSPGSYNNALTVASIDNAGSTGMYFTVGDNIIFYSDSSTQYGAEPFQSIAGEHEYVFIDGVGTPEDWAALGEGALEGKIAVCSRGTTSFFEKANAAVEAGAIATIIYNNQEGTIGLNLTGYNYDAPCISILQSEGKILRDLATPVEVKPEETTTPADTTPADSSAADTTPADTSAADTTPADTSAADTTPADTTAEDTTPADTTDADTTPADTTPADEETPAEAEDAAVTAAPDEAAPAEAEEEADEKVVYYLGTMNVNDKVASTPSDAEYYTMSSFSSWGVPGSLTLKPEITAPGGNIYSINGSHQGEAGNPGGSDQYENMSGTSMAAPQIAGLSALAAQYVREKGLAEKTGEDERTLIQSLLMSTAEPVLESAGIYYSVLKQGAGLANINNVVNADSYILMGADATVSYNDGKVKAELGDDPNKKGEYTFSFTVNNLTAEEKAFDLSADLFTQAIDGYFLSKTTANLASNATFSGADVSGSTVTVAANGSAKVTVTLTLTDSAKTALEEYVNGAYIEGFVFVKPSGANADKRVAHSIPVLGFYGNWSDPSMFEVGSYEEYYLSGTEDRPPYLGDEVANAILYTDADNNKQYYFGGNPYDPYEEYIPERNAINGKDTISVSYMAVRNAADSRFAVYDKDNKLLSSLANGQIMCAYYYANGETWRNTGSMFRAGDLSSISENTNVTLAFEAALEYYVDDKGNVAWDKLGKGASISMPAVVDNTAPVVLSVEVNNANSKLIVTVKDNQYVAAIALFDRTGTKLYASDYADLDAKKGEKTVYELPLDGVQGKKFMLQAFDYAGNTTTYEIKHQIGEDVELPEMIALNYGGLTGNSFYWVGLNEETTAFDLVDAYAPSDMTVMAATIADHYVYMCNNNGELFVAPEYDLGDVTKICDLTVTLDGEVIPIRVQDMAYNSADGNIYAMLNGLVLSIDKLTGEVEIVGMLPFTSYTLACDKEGNFYTNEYGTGAVYKFTLDSIDEDGVFDAELLCEYEGFVSKYLQAMEVNPDTGMLWWTACSDDSSPFIMIDPESGDLTAVNEDLIFQLTALIIPQTTDADYDFNGDGLVNEEDAQALLDYRTGVISEITNEENADFDNNGVIDTYDVYLFLNRLWTAPTRNVTGIQIEAETELTVGYTEKLSAIIQPWTALDKSVTWTSDDTSVATVNENGVIEAVGVGECTITAVPNANKNISATCKVTVKGLEVTIDGLLQNEDGETKFYNWNMAETSRWTETGDFPSGFISALKYSFMGFLNYLYVVDWDGNLQAYSHDGETYYGLVREGLPFFDMESSEYFSMFPMMLGVNGDTNLYIYDCIMSNQLQSFDLARLGITGDLIGVANEGWWGVRVGGVVYDSEILAFLDTTGTIHEIALVDNEQGTIGYLGSYDTGINEPFKGTNGAPLTSMMYSEDEDCFYISTMNASDDTSKIYRVETLADGTCSTGLIGNMGGNVWPSMIFSATPNEDAEAAEVKHFFGETPSMFATDGVITEELKRDEKVLVETQTLELKNTDVSVLSTPDADTDGVNAVKEAASDNTAAAPKTRAFNANANNVQSEKAAKAVSKNNARTSIGRAADEGEEVEVIEIPEGQLTTSIDVPAGIDAEGNAAPVTNGLAIITYDPSIVSFDAVTDMPTDYYSVNVNEDDGIILLAYASKYVIPESEEMTISFVTEDMTAGEVAPISIGYAELANGEETDETGAPVYMNLLLEVKDSDGNPVNSLGDFINNASKVEEVLANPDMPKADVEIEVADTVPAPTPTPGGTTPPSGGTIVIVDDETGVKVEVGSGNVDEGAELVVEETGKDDNSVSVDISVVVGGVEVQPSGEMVVSIPVPEGFNGDDCHVYRVEADGTLTDMNAVHENGMLVFKTDRLGEFVVSVVKTDVPADTNKPAESDPAVNDPTGTNEPDVSIGGNGNNGGDTTEPGSNGGDNVPSTGVAFIIAPAAISALAVVAAKKHRK